MAAYDLVVIGTGAAGMAAAIRGDELGARVAISEQGTLGGTCVNVGCVPSKTLIRAAEARHRSQNPRFSGIRAAAGRVDLASLIAQKDELVSSLRQAKYADVLAGLANVERIQGRATVGAGPAVAVDGRSLRARAVVIATGASPVAPPIPGIAETPYLTHVTAMALDRLPGSLIVLGGRYVALELAQMFQRLGSQVTLVQRSERVLPSEDDDVTEAVEGYLREEGMAVRTGGPAQRVRRDGRGVVVTVRTRDGIEELEAEELLVAAGRRPNSRGLGVEALGVRFGQKDEIVTGPDARTAADGIFAAGDVAGDPAFVYTAAHEGALAAENAIQGTARRKDEATVPWVVFTDPQLASVGLTEKAARAAGVEVEVRKLPIAQVARAVAARDTRGFIKLLAEPETGRLLGATVLAPEGGELISEATLAVRFGLTVDQIASTYHPYLTMAEGLKLAARSFRRDVTRLSCCAA